MQRIQLIKGDCLEKMKDIPDKSIDMILCDPPYGTTACKWDSVIPFEPMWAELTRVRKDRAAVVLFGREPFSSALRMSNIKGFKYDWVWRKTKAQGMLNAKKRPLVNYEIISVFYSGVYFPQGLVEGIFNNSRPAKGRAGSGIYGGQREFAPSKYGRYPKSVLDFPSVPVPVHPTQKPVALLEYLIKTYTLENETVLDYTMGSGSTGVACVNTGRGFIGIEKDDNYFTIAKDRISRAHDARASEIVANVK